MEREIRLDFLCSEYGKRRFLNWCNSLKIFRFCKSHPYPDDLLPDRFIALATFENNEELQNILNILEIEPPIEIQEILEKETVLSKDVKINSTSCYIEINRFLNNLVFTVSGTEEDQFIVDDSTFKRAKRIDDYLSTLNLKYASSPYNDDYCITPEFYPEIWEE